jgi:hypothetical protein
MAFLVHDRVVGIVSEGVKRPANLPGECGIDGNVRAGRIGSGGASNHGVGRIVVLVGGVVGAAVEHEIGSALAGRLRETDVGLGLPKRESRRQRVLFRLGPVRGCVEVIGDGARSTDRRVAPLEVLADGGIGRWMIVVPRIVAGRCDLAEVIDPADERDFLVLKRIHDAVPCCRFGLQRLQLPRLVMRYRTHNGHKGFSAVHAAL